MRDKRRAIILLEHLLVLLESFCSRADGDIAEVKEMIKFISESNYGE